MVSDVFDKEENRMNYIRGMLHTLTKREENVEVDPMSRTVFLMS